MKHTVLIAAQHKFLRNSFNFDFVCLSVVLSVYLFATCFVCILLLSNEILAASQQKSAHAHRFIKSIFFK